MPNTKHLNIINRGVAIWNDWRIKYPDQIPDLSWASIAGMNLKGINLANSNLKLAFCKDCDFSDANLNNIIFFGANLENSLFNDTDACNANFEGALLKKTVFKNTRLRHCNFKLATLEDALFENTDVTGAKNLRYEQMSRVKKLNNSKFDIPLMEKIRELNPFLLNGD